MGLTLKIAPDYAVDAFHLHFMTSVDWTYYVTQKMGFQRIDSVEFRRIPTKTKTPLSLSSIIDSHKL
jgi:hypothetical protein